MKFLIVRYNRNGSLTLSDDISGQKCTFFGYNERDAIREHRRATNTRYKRFCIIRMR